MNSHPRQNWLITGVVILIFFAGYTYFSKAESPNALKLPFPYTMNVSTNTSFACESIMSADLIGSPEEYLTNGIEGTVQKGTDTVAMNIKDSKTLNFLTGASIKAGVSEGDNFAILQNDDQKLMAAWFSDSVISTVVLNKTNGLALWLKGSPDFVTYEGPHGQIIYLKCI